MITALINEETQAINTESPSKVRAKLIPIPNVLVKVKLWPEITKGSNLRDKTTETETKTSASRFLRRLENLPIKGRLKAKMQGTNIINSKVVRFSIGH